MKFHESIYKKKSGYGYKKSTYGKMEKNGEGFLIGWPIQVEMILR
jgi:hypothetical protein